MATARVVKPENEGTNRSAFLERWSVFDKAAVGVTFIRTREPLRANEALREWSYSKRRKFKLYSLINGWNTFDLANAEANPTADRDLNIVSAISKVAGFTEASGFDEGVFVIFWPHFQLPKMPAFMQLMLELSRICAEQLKRVAMLVPPGFEIPSELQDSIPVLDFDMPNHVEVRQSYNRVLNAIPSDKRPQYSEPQIEQIISALAGMTEMEAESSIARAAADHSEVLPNVPHQSFLQHVMRTKTEAVRRSEVLEVMPFEDMSNVGGLDLLKSWVEERKCGFGKDARDAGVDRPKGFLVVGPPGGGKSLVAKATAHALGLPLIKFDINRVYGSLVGASESRIREALKTLEAMAPVCVLIDEVDKAISMNSSTNDGGVSTRVLGTLLTFMQENDKEVFWVITANRTSNLPSELVRKGRLDEVFSVLMPDENERREIFNIHLRRRKVDAATIKDLDLAVTAASGYVGAEIEQAVKDAKLHSYRTKAPITGSLMAEFLGKSKPLSVAFAEDFRAMEEWAANNARPSSSGTVQKAVASARTRTRGDRQMRVDDTTSAVIPGQIDLDG